MLIFFLVAMTPLLLAPAWTYRVFSEAERFERRQIAVDNAAIELGRGDRAALRTLEEGQRRIRVLERAHHLVHFCARVPETAPACAAEDRALEAGIRVYSLALRVRAQAAWVASLARARKALTGIGNRAGVLGRAVVLPLRPRRCSVCGGDAGWELAEPPPLRWRVLSPGEREAEVWAELSRDSAGSWDYALMVEPHRGAR